MYLDAVGMTRANNLMCFETELRRSGVMGYVGSHSALLALL